MDAVDPSQDLVQFENLDPVIQEIVKEAKAVRSNAHCPYSKFAVGAALLCENGSIIQGCNVENVSFGLTICAERSAIVRAVAQGIKTFKSVAICAEMKQRFVGPCGACRQVLAEFNISMDVYLCQPDSDSILKTSMDKLLPLSFIPSWVDFSTSAN